MLARANIPLLPFRQAASPMSESAIVEVPLTQRAVLVMAGACGFGAANIYYNQPMLADIVRDLGSPAAAGVVPTVTQVGYALGLLLLSPLADRFDPKTLILAN